MIDYTRAACRGADPGIFTPEWYTPADHQRASEFCHRCPIAADCLQDGQRLGGWGTYGGVWLEGGKPKRQPPPADHTCPACGTRPIPGTALTCDPCRPLTARATSDRGRDTRKEAAA